MLLLAENAWGIKLGQKVAAIRSTGKYIQNRNKRLRALEALGFVWRARSPSKGDSKHSHDGISFDQLYTALLAYRQQVKPDGSLTVPAEFIVPDVEPWPENTRGMPLGLHFGKVRSEAFLKDNPEAESKLSAIGVQVDQKVATSNARFHRVYDALRRYKDIYGDLLVPQPFVVPDKSADWPEDTWRLRLGARVNAMRSQGTFVKANPERKDLLDTIGFAWSPPQSERRRRGRKSKAEKDRSEGEVLVTSTKMENTHCSTPEIETSHGTSSEVTFSTDVDSHFGSSFDFGKEPAEISDSGSEKASPTWGLERVPEVDNASTKEDAAFQDDPEYFYQPLKLLSETLLEAKRRAAEVGVIDVTRYV
jgi:hypothetical protein